MKERGKPDESKKPDFSKMRPFNADCNCCPLPDWRKQGLCCLCCSLMVDESGVKHVNPEPLISDRAVKEDSARKKEARGRRRK